MDDADYAQELEERERRLGVEAALAVSRLVRQCRGGRDCVACGEPIPPLRLMAVPGACFCFECQESKEKR